MPCHTISSRLWIEKNKAGGEATCSLNNYATESVVNSDFLSNRVFFQFRKKMKKKKS